MKKIVKEIEYTEKMLLAKARNRVKFDLNGILTRLNIYKEITTSLDYLTINEQQKLGGIVEQINYLFKAWDSNTFTVGLTPTPLYVVYNRAAKKIERTFKHGGPEYRLLYDFYKSDRILYSIKKLVSQEDFQKFLIEGDRIFPEGEREFQKNSKKWLKEISKQI